MGTIISMCIILLIAMFIIVLARTERNSNLGLSLLLALGLGAVVGLGVKSYDVIMGEDIVQTTEVEKANIAELPTQFTYYPAVLETAWVTSHPGIASQVAQQYSSLLFHTYSNDYVDTLTSEYLVNSHIWDSS